MNSQAFLVVDDDVTVLRSIERTLKENLSNREVFTALDGNTALLIARQLGSRLELLITDQQLGSIKGTDLARHIKYLYPKVKVLILTGYQDSDTLEGFDVLGKPVGNNELVSFVQAKIGHLSVTS